jgi:ribose/xylose/arabinose/galactoside ABC-type transport system permease subunit
MQSKASVAMPAPSPISAPEARQVQWHDFVVYIIFAIAMTFVIVASELDLSIGSSAALSALVAALVMAGGYGIVVGVIAGILSGLAVGSLNSFSSRCSKFRHFLRHWVPCN